MRRGCAEMKRLIRWMRCAAWRRSRSWSWHWQHFFALSRHLAGGLVAATGQPFYWLLKPLYLEGWAAVDLFFALSGFVFFWLYREAIREKRKVGRHDSRCCAFRGFIRCMLLMLIVVAGSADGYFSSAEGSFFIFPAGRWGRFAAHLFVVQQWLPPERRQTFNGPGLDGVDRGGALCAVLLACRTGSSGLHCARVALAGRAVVPVELAHCARLDGFLPGRLAYFALWQQLRDHPRLALVTRGLVIAVVRRLWRRSARSLFLDLRPLARRAGYYSDNVAISPRALYFSAHPAHRAGAGVE